MERDEAAALRKKIAELTEELASLEGESRKRHERLILAHNQALEAALIALAVEVREELDAPDLIERVSERLTYTTVPKLRLLKDPDSNRGADAVESLAGRLDEAEKRPKFQR